MLTQHDLARLERSLRGMKVLSVYVDGAAADPAARARRRRELARGVARARAALEGTPRAERVAFDRCAALLEEHLARHPDGPGAPGWVGFFPSRGEAYTDAAPASVPNLVAWDDGPLVSPYVHALKQHVPVVLAVVSSRVARVHRYAHGVLEPVDTLRAREHPEGAGTAEHMGYPPRLGFHAGTRGTAGADAWDRQRRADTGALVRELAARLEALAGHHAWIALGGIREVVAQVARALPERLRGRTREVAADVHAAPPVLREASERVASAASRERDLARVLALLERDAAGGRGAAGVTETDAALRQRSAERLLFTGAFLRAHPQDGERLVRMALEQDAELEYVAGAGADRLDAAGGVGATLRFVPPQGRAIPDGGSGVRRLGGAARGGILP